jgi:hypothetical protein
MTATLGNNQPDDKYKVFGVKKWTASTMNTSGSSSSGGNNTTQTQGGDKGF